LRRTPIDQIRSLCVALPEAHEVEAWGEPTFRVRNKIFVMYASSDTHHGSGRPGIWCKSTFTNQELLIRAEPDRYFSPPYVGPKGWVGVYLDRSPDWTAVADLIETAYRLIAPKRLTKQR
jgi:predicted DNA-binding protein (MmcQ/YjbR family)